MKYGEKIYLGIMSHDNKIFCEECASKFLEIEARRGAKAAELLGSVLEMQGNYSSKKRSLLWNYGHINKKHVKPYRKNGKRVTNEHF